MDCEIETGIYFVVLNYMERMDDRVFQYSIHGGKAKDDPYFSDYYNTPVIETKNDDSEEFDLDQFKNARKYLIASKQSSCG